MLSVFHFIIRTITEERSLICWEHCIDMCAKHESPQYRPWYVILFLFCQICHVSCLRVICQRAKWLCFLCFHFIKYDMFNGSNPALLKDCLWYPIVIAGPLIYLFLEMTSWQPYAISITDFLEGCGLECLLFENVWVYTSAWGRHDMGIISV